MVGVPGDVVTRGSARHATVAVVDASAASTEELNALFADVAGGDRDAFAAFYDATIGTVFGLVVRVLRDRAQAEEVVQEVYVQVWEHAARFDSSRGSAHAWLVTIAHRRAVDRVRSADRATRREQWDGTRAARPAPSDVAEVVADRDEEDRLHRAVAALPAGQREALVLAYFEGCTHREVAEVLGIPLGTAKTRIRDAVARLRGMTDQDWTGPATTGKGVTR